MSTILKALRRLEEDSSPDTANATDSFPATDPRAADELRERILAEESAAQADAAVQHDSDRTKRIVRNVAFVFLTTGLGVVAYTMSTRIGSDPTLATAIANPTQVSAPVIQERHVEEAPVATTALQPTNDRAVVPPIPPISPPGTLARNESRENGSEEMLTGSPADPSRGSSPDFPPEVASVPMLVPAPTIVSSPSSMATSSPASSAVSPSSSSSSATRSSERSPATKAVAPSAANPSDEADEMALGAVTPTTSSLAATSRRSVATPETSGSEPSAPPRRPKRAKIDTSPPSVSAPQSAPNPEPVSTTLRTTHAVVASKAKSTEHQPSRKLQSSESSRSSGKSRPSAESRTPEESRTSRQSQLGPSPGEVPGEVERLDHRGLPDLTVIRTAWHPNASRRSARIRLEDTDEILTLREGDAIGGLVIKKISPSAVLFKSGDVEVRRRVGQPGSGG